MKKYFLKQGMSGMVSVDTEIANVDVIDYCRTGIDWIYEVPEDGELSVKDSDVQNIPVKKGNIVVLFYADYGLKHRAVVVDNAEWKENMEAYKAKQLEESKKYADASKCYEACPDCPNCKREAA